MKKTEPKIVVKHLSAADVKREMRVYEKKYGMKSDEFWTKYFGGEFDGTADFVHWIGLCRMAKTTADSAQANTK